MDDIYVQENPYGNNSSGYYTGQATSQMAQRVPTNGERYRAILMSVFLNSDQHKVPDLLTNPMPPADLEIDLIIDDQGHSSLHWAAALARINILQLLLNLGADPRRVNFSGESALIRAVLVTNNFDNDCFYNLLTLLHTAIDITDKKGRSVIHHIALTAGIKGRFQASRYYLDHLLDFMTKSGMDIGMIIDLQDKNGDTALNIAARIGNRQLVEQLLRCGANSDIPNRAGLRPVDFGVEDATLATLFQNRSLSENALDSALAVAAADVSVMGSGSASGGFGSVNFRSRESSGPGEFETVVANLENELAQKESSVQETVNQLQSAVKELTESRKAVQQLSTRVAHLEVQNRMLESQLAGNAQLPAIGTAHQLEVQVEKLKAMLFAYGVDPEGGQLITNGSNVHHHHHHHSHGHGIVQHQNGGASQIFPPSISDLPQTFQVAESQ